MASGTINFNNSGTTSGGGYLMGKVVWSSSADTTNNTSSVTAKLYVKKAITSGTINVATTGHWDVSLTVNGSNVSDSVSNSITADWVLLLEKTVTVNHNSDGTRSIEIAGSAYGPSGTSYSGLVTKGSKTVELDTIARASVPTVSADSVKMGAKLTITTNRKSGSFTHTLQYKFGSKSGTIATDVGASYAWTVPDLASYCSNATSGSCTITCVTYNGSTKVGSKTVSVTLNVPDATAPTLSASSVNMGSAVTINLDRASSNFKHTLSYTFADSDGSIASDVTTSKSWTPPISLASKIPSATSGSCTITCVTKNGTATVGTKTVKLTLKVPNNSTTRPSVSMEISQVQSIPAAFDGLYIQGKSKVEAVMTAESDYSTISSYKLSVDGNTKSGSASTITSDVLSSSGSITVKGTVTDARGYSSSAEESITVISYSKPTVIPYSGESSVICARCTSGGTPSPSGTHLLIQAGRKYSTVTANDVQKNFCLLRYRYKTEAASSFGAWATLIAKDSMDSNFYSGVISGIELDVKTSYQVEIAVADDVGESSTLAFDIPTDAVALHLKPGGKGAAFGKYAEEDGLLDVDWNLHVGGWPVARLKLLLTRSEGWASGEEVLLPDLADCDAALIFFYTGTQWSYGDIGHALIPVNSMGVLESVINMTSASALAVCQRRITIASDGTVTSGQVWIKAVNSESGASDNQNYPYALSPFEIYGLKWS